MIIHQKTWLPTFRLIPLAMVWGIVYERKVGTVMNWALFATWTRKEQVCRLLMKRNSLGSIQGFKFEEEEGNFGLEGKSVENKVANKVIITPIELKPTIDTSQILEYCASI
jgi:hypothetical protein